MNSSRWEPSENNIWNGKQNRRIALHSDPVVCLSSLENDICHEIAAKKLQRDYGISVARREDRRWKLRFRMGHFNKPHYQNIFSMDLQERALRSKYANGNQCFRYNSEYKLHVDKFFITSIDLLTKFQGDKLELFEINGCPVRTHQITELISRSENWTLDEEFDIPEVASLLKIYLLNMPGGCFTEALEMHFLNTAEFSMIERIDMLSKLVRVLPRANREVIFLLFAIFYQIWTDNGSDMTISRLTCIFSPLLFPSMSVGAKDTAETVENMIQFFPNIFMLSARDLNDIYIRLLEKHPRKISQYMQRRIDQAVIKGFHFPKCLRALTVRTRFLPRDESPQPSNLDCYGRLVRNSACSNLQLLGQVADESSESLQSESPPSSLNLLVLNFEDDEVTHFYTNEKVFACKKFEDDYDSLPETRRKVIWLCDVPEVRF